MTPQRYLIPILSLVVALLGGCATQEKPLYHWDNYQQQVYAYFKNEGSSKEEQIAALEESLEKARAKGMALPPGYHAHLGLLYLDTGKEDQARQEFETEKTLFPESTAYMDFLLRKFKH